MSAMVNHVGLTRKEGKARWRSQPRLYSIHIISFTSKFANKGSFLAYFFDTETEPYRHIWTRLWCEESSQLTDLCVDLTCARKKNVVFCWKLSNWKLWSDEPKPQCLITIFVVSNILIWFEIFLSPVCVPCPSFLPKKLPQKALFENLHSNVMM